VPDLNHARGVAETSPFREAQSLTRAAEVIKYSGGI
jgi:hypothetical protein